MHNTEITHELSARVRPVSSAMACHERSSHYRTNTPSKHNYTCACEKGWSDAICRRRPTTSSHCPSTGAKGSSSRIGKAFVSPGNKRPSTGWSLGEKLVVLRHHQPVVFIAGGGVIFASSRSVPSLPRQTKSCASCCFLTRWPNSSHSRTGCRRSRSAPLDAALGHR